MINEAEITPLLTPPDNWQWGELFNDKKQKIRYGWNCPSTAKALIILAEGRTEVIEEYFETIRVLNENGFACAIMDWQGQGLSYRYFDDNTRHHSEGFDRDIQDFECFHSMIKDMKEFEGLPVMLFAHSMGGNITLRYLSKYPKSFLCAYMSAPMLGLNPKRIIKFTAFPVLKMVTRLNRLTHYAFGQTRWSETFANIAKFKVSSDPVRREVQPYLFKTKPELQCGGVTFGWLAEALKSINLLHQKSVCRRITTPICMAMAGKDIVVDNEGSYKTASLLPHCEVIEFAQSEHQIHRERDEIRSALMNSMMDFFNKYL